MNKKQSGSAHLVIIVILSLALLGTLGFVYYQNFIQNKDTVSKTDTDKDKTTEKSTDNTTKTVVTVVDPATVVNDFLTSFLSYMNSSVSNKTDAAFAAQSTALTNDFRNSITSPNQGLTRSPIILAQDIPSGFTVGAVTTATNIKSVYVTFNYANNSSTIIYSLVLVDNQWKINGVANA